MSPALQQLFTLNTRWCPYPRRYTSINRSRHDIPESFSGLGSLCLKNPNYYNNNLISVIGHVNMFCFYHKLGDGYIIHISTRFSPQYSKKLLFGI